MITKKKFTKTIIAFTLGVILIFMASFGLFDILSLKSVKATGNGTDIKLSITNSTFDSYSSSTGQPNSFTRYMNGQELSTETDSDVEAKIIDITSATYSALYKTAFPENYKKVLMISGENMSDINYGYVANSSLKLSENSYYKITVDVFTAENDGIGTITLENGDTEYASMNNVISYKGWSTYTFLIATKDATEVKLGLYLRKEGTILFDNLSCYKIGQHTLNGLKTSYEADETLSNRFKYVNKYEEPLSSFIISNNQIVDKNTPSNSYDIVASGNITPETVANPDGLDTISALKLTADNTQAFIHSYSNATKDLFTFKKNSVYKVTIKAKITELKGDAYFRLVQTKADECVFEENQTAVDSQYLTISGVTTGSENVDYDYTTYSFYVNSDPLEDMTYKLECGFGSSEKASGVMYISNIEVSLVNSSSFTNASSSNKIDLATDNINVGADHILDNGHFNGIEIADQNNPIPATASNWSVEKGSNNQIYGVVSVDANSFEEFKNIIPSAVNPYGTQGRPCDNVLMMYNEEKDTISYISTSKELPAREHHNFRISVQTQNSSVKLALVAKVDDKFVELSSITADGEDYTWKDYDLAIYTGYQKLDVAVKVTMTTEGNGFAYVDNAYFDGYLSEANNKLKFETAQTNSSALAIDMSNFMSSSETKQWANTELFSQPSTEENDIVYQGIIDLTSNNLHTTVFPNDSYVESFISIGSTSAFGIHAMEGTNYITTSKSGFDLKKGNYYKLEVSVYSMLTGDHNGVAGIKLTNFDNSFTTINTNNEWQTYTFYISPSEDTTAYLELSLGNEANQTQGSVFFSNIKFYDSTVESDKPVISSDIFNEATASDVALKLQDVTVQNDDSSSSTDKENENSNSASTWWYAVPSIIFALTVVLCIVVIVIRKVKKKKPYKKSSRTTTYDRKTTVSTQVYTRKATAIRERKLYELKNDLEKLNEERNKLETEYKQNMIKLREMKIKRRDANEIAKLEREVRKIQKSTSTAGLAVTKIQNEIEYVKTDMYFKSLIKKLTHEGLVNENEEEKEEDK